MMIYSISPVYGNRIQIEQYRFNSILLNVRYLSACGFQVGSCQERIELKTRMECNRDEALRARDISEIKFTTKDIEGAKRFALKAQSLHPGLDGISQMVATLDVYLAAKPVVNGEKDWYSILGVSASADEEMIKKQYKTSALLLHPDKNKSVGAEGAFKLISEAWSVLSDKSRRMAYDQKRNIKGKEQITPQPNRDCSVANAANGFYRFVNGAAFSGRTQNITSHGAPPSVPHPRTFRTSCKKCKMQNEYLRVYLNHTLVCPSCHEPFLATEVPVPTNGPNSSAPWDTEQHQQSLNHNYPSKNDFSSQKITPAVPGMRPTRFQHGSTCESYHNPNFQWGAFSTTADAASAASSFSAATQTVNMVHQTNGKVRRERREAKAAAKRAEVLQRKNHVSTKSMGVLFSGNSNAGFANNISKRVCPSIPTEDRPAKRSNIGDDGGSNNVDDGSERKTFAGNTNKAFDNTAVVSETKKVNDFASDTGKVTSKSSVLSRELSHLNIRNMLIRKAKVALQKKLEDLNSVVAEKMAGKEEAKQKQKQKKNDGKEQGEVHVDASDELELDESKNKQVLDEVSTPSVLRVEADGEVWDTISINVPDPDFHDFDMDRLERCFEAHQVWASYDDDDGMPCFYVMIRDVLSLEPFKVRLSFLNSRSTSEFGQLNWIGSGFAKTCGDFRLGRCESRKTVNIFSHQVRWERGLRGAIRIVPRKGDIWALYRNWSPHWDENTPDEITHKYDMVEVLEDYTEEGVCVIPLVKVPAFMTVFHRHLDSDKVRRIPREEMFRFSHQVPYYMLRGEEADNAPKGCYELDPAATPLDLLQVISEAEEKW